MVRVRFADVDLASAGAAVRKNVRKSPLVPRRMNSVTWPVSAGQATVQNGPLFSLTPHTVSKLEDLLLEGDSLEVSLDETVNVGRIIQVLFFFIIFKFTFLRIFIFYLLNVQIAGYQVTF